MGDPFNLAELGIAWDKPGAESESPDKQIVFKIRKATPKSFSPRRGAGVSVPEHVINVAVAELYGALLQQRSPERAELRKLRSEVAALRGRLDKIEDQLAAEETVDQAIANEIAAICTDLPVPDDIKPEDWLPTGEELDELMSED